MTTDLFDALILQYNNKEDGVVYYTASRNSVGNLVVSWNITFRRNTRVGAYSSYMNAIARANAKMNAIANEHSSVLMSNNNCTIASCQKVDDLQESNGESAYSEYEQSIGGWLVLKSTAKVKRVRDGRKFHKDLHAVLDKKLNGKKRLKADFHVSRMDAMSGFEVSWSFKFSNMRYSSAIAENRAMWDKVNEIMDSIIAKYNDHVVSIRRETVSGYRELDRYVLASEVKNQHVLTGRIKFSEVLPTDQYVIDLNNRRKAGV